MNEILKVDSNSAKWEKLEIPELKSSILSKPLFLDSFTGMSISKVRYPAGFINKNHKHNCAHGMYVLDGVLETSEGSLGPGNFIWFPEGTAMFHGAKSDNDVTFLFITDKPFDVEYV